MHWQTVHSLAKSFDRLLKGDYSYDNFRHIIDKLRHFNHVGNYRVVVEKARKEDLKGLTDLGEVNLKIDPEEKRELRELNVQPERIGMYKVMVTPGKISFWHFSKASEMTSADVHELAMPDKHVILFDYFGEVIDFCRYAYYEPRQVWPLIGPIVYTLVYIFSFGTMSDSLKIVKMYEVEREMHSLLNNGVYYEITSQRYYSIE